MYIMGVLKEQYMERGKVHEREYERGNDVWKGKKRSKGREHTGEKGKKGTQRMNGIYEAERKREWKKKGKVNMRGIEKNRNLAVWGKCWRNK